MPVGLNLVVRKATDYVARHRQGLAQQRDWVCLRVGKDGSDDIAGDAVVGGIIHDWPCERSARSEISGLLLVCCRVARGCRWFPIRHNTTMFCWNRLADQLDRKLSRPSFCKGICIIPKFLYILWRRYHGYGLVFNLSRALAHPLRVLVAGQIGIRPDHDVTPVQR